MIGVLLINLGTPDAPDVKHVRRYLREFLSDRRVIELPAIARWLLLNVFILPFRPKQSAKAYQHIWQPDGSPLMINSIKLKNKLSHRLGENYCIEIGMRYGTCNIPSAVDNLLNQDCDQFIVLPLFPQYSSAATGSAIEAFYNALRNKNYQPNVTVINSFHRYPEFINAYTKIIRENIAKEKIEYVLFSYHGLPDRPHNALYAKQCHETTEMIANSLQLHSNKYGTAFQSRLGRTPWIQPYTDLVLPKLIERGIKNIAIVCPSFVADCLETLEEIGLRAKEQWISLGGNEFILIPCLNDDAYWVDGLYNIVIEKSPSKEA